MTGLARQSTVHRKIFLFMQAFAIFCIIGSVTSQGNHAKISKRSVLAPRVLRIRVAWIDRFIRGCVIPLSDYDSYGGLDHLSEHLSKVFARPNSPGHQLKPITSAKNLYKACNNLGYDLSRDSPASDPDWSRLRDILKMFGGWPVIEGDSWSEENKSWRDLQIKLSKTGFDGFIEACPAGLASTTVIPAEKIFKYHELQNSVNDSVVMEYRDKLVDIAVKMGADRDNAKREIEDALKFDHEFPDRIGAPLRWNVTTLVAITGISEAELTHIWPPNFNLKTDDLRVEHQKITETRNKLDQSPLRVIFNHAMMRIVSQLTSLSKDQLKRQEECTDFMSMKLSDLQEIIFLQPRSPKNTTKENTDNVSETSSQPSELKEQHYNFTSLSEVQDGGKIEAYYRNLEEIKEDNFLDGVEKLIRYRFDHKISLFCPSLHW